MTYNSEQVNLLGVQSVLIYTSLTCHYSYNVSIDFCCWLAASDIIIQEWHVKDSTDPGFYFLYCGMWKLYYVFPPGYMTRSISSWYNTISKIRNDDQSLSPVTPLVSFFCRSYSLKMFRNIFNLLVSRIFIIP